MNFLKLFFFVISMSAVETRRLQSRGNMRGTVTFASGLSPIQIKIIKLLAKQKCIRRYGRFSQNFC